MEVSLLKPRLVFLVKQLALGGAEQTIVTLAERLVGDWDVRVVFCFGQDAHSARLAARGVRVARLSATRSPARTAAAMHRYLRAARPDVVNAHDGFSAILARVTAPRAVPVITTIQNVTTAYRPQVAAVDRATSLLLGAGTICVSREVERAWLSGPLAEPLRRRPVRTVIPNPVDLDAVDRAVGAERSHVRAELGIPPDAELIANVGRFVEQKGQRALLEAVAELLPERPAAWLVLIGYGRLERELRERAEGLGIAHRTTFAVHRSDVPRIMRAADAFAFPSLFEGLGVAVIEAMAVGLPVVASDIPPLTELIEHGRTGLLTRVSDPPALAQALARVLSDREEAAALARAGREIARTRHDPQRVASAYDAFFRARSRSAPA